MLETSSTRPPNLLTSRPAVMRTLAKTLVTIVLYELALFLLTAVWMMRRASALAETREGTWVELVPMPAWWKALIVVPLLILLVRWLIVRRARP